MGYLVDTNVVSEICKKSPSAKVIAWIDAHSEELYLSVVTIEEMRFGELMMPKGKRRDKLHSMIDALLDSYDSRILAFDARAAEICASFHEKAIASGRTPTIEDLMIAAIAQGNELTVATRNTRDFAYLYPDIVNPFN